MKVLKKYNQNRRDCYIDIECEGCGNKKENVSAYDDRYFWDNVVPDMKCKKCGKSANDLGIKKEFIQTKYADYEVV
jgi:ribosomal protein S27E